MGPLGYTGSPPTLKGNLHDLNGRFAFTVQKGIGAGLSLDLPSLLTLSRVLNG